MAEYINQEALEAKKILEKALDTYGSQAQITMVFEEMSELRKELCKYLRGKNDSETIEHVAEEIADVEIMLEQMKLLFGIDDDVADYREEKILRLKWRLEEG